MKIMTKEEFKKDKIKRLCELHSSMLNFEPPADLPDVVKYSARAINYATSMVRYANMQYQSYEGYLAACRRALVGDLRALVQLKHNDEVIHYPFGSPVGYTRAELRELAESLDNIEVVIGRVVEEGYKDA